MINLDRLQAVSVRLPFEYADDLDGVIVRVHGQARVTDDGRLAAAAALGEHELVRAGATVQTPDHGGLPAQGLPRSELPCRAPAQQHPGGHGEKPSNHHR